MALASLLAVSLALNGFQGAFAQTVQNQVNISMCNWFQFRANIIRDTVYLDGGSLWWRRGLSDGRQSTDSDGNPNGIIYGLHLGQSFDTSKDNLTALFHPLPKPVANNISPTTKDGVMFANDHEFILYGGLVLRSDAFSRSPSADSFLTYERFQYGPYKASWSANFVQGSSGDVHRYITHGAGVSAPSENTGFYFSGKRGQGWGEIQNPEPVANLTANTLISVDMSVMREEKWRNHTIHSSVRGRANAELAWLPVSRSGVLVAIGGVSHAVDILGQLSADQVEENNSTGSDFMRRVPVYDVASETWFVQNTTGDYPPPLSQFCSVVATARDSSSHNIYIYGGYEGTNRTQRPSDAVYVLSVPSFTWVRVYDGASNFGRRGHKCVKTYPDKMFVLGGQYLDPSQCLPGGFIRVFNLNTLEFQDKYDPKDWDEYEVPDMITARIGGDGAGGAETREPERWADDALREIFRTEYTKTISHYYPYNATDIPTTPTSTAEEGNDGDGDDGLPDWVPPVLGVILGLVFIGIVAIGLLLWLRRRQSRYAPSEVPTENRNRILGWMYGVVQPTHKPEETVTSTEIGIYDKPVLSGLSEAGHDSVAFTNPTSTAVRSDDSNAQEAGGMGIHEMQADAPLELPTEYNVPLTTPTSAKARHLSDTPSFRGTVSRPISPTPEPPQSPEPPRSPSHNRNHSSISSAGFPASLAEAIAREEAETHRRRHVSAFVEDLPPPDEEEKPKPSS